MKKTLAILLALTLCLAAAVSVSAEDAAAPLTAEELTAWTETLKARALDAEPLEMGEGEDPETEKGFLFNYDFAALYADTAELTADSRINAAQISGDGESFLRDLAIDMTPWDVIARFPNDNPHLAGDREDALLYLRDTDNGGFAFGRVFRDGQRIAAIEYADLVPEGEGFRAASLTFYFSDSLLIQALAAGMAGEDVVSREEANELRAALNALEVMDEYAAVKSSRNGLELDEFCEADLFFSGLDFLNMKPEDLPGEPERDLFDNEDGTWLLTLDEEAWEAVFQCDKNGDSATIVSFMIKDDSIEGPRAVRLGDQFHEVLQRFRFEENETDGISEVLYGTENTVPRGTVLYVGDDGMTMRYVCEVSGGRQVELLLRYTQNELSEIIIHII